MPIVLSYNDVEALGALAHGAGVGAGQVQRQDRDIQTLLTLEGQRRQADAHSQRIAASERQAEADRGLRRDLFTADRQFTIEQQQLQTAQREHLEAQRFENQRSARLEQEALAQQGRVGRDVLQHQLGMVRDQRQAELGRWQSRTATAAPTALPGRDQINAEMERFGHLLPFDAGYDAWSAARRADELRSEAQQITGLPTDTLREMIAQRPQDPMNPYLSAVIEARQAAAPTPGPQGPDQGAGHSGLVPGGGLRGTGFGDPLRDLTDEQIRALADRPELLEQYLGETQTRGVEGHSGASNPEAGSRGRVPPMPSPQRDPFATAGSYMGRF